MNAARLRAGGVVHVGHLFGAVDDAHAAPAAAGAGLDDDRVADLLAPGQGVLDVSTTPSLPGMSGTPGRLHGGLGLGLVAHPADDLGVGADEDDAAGLADVHEVRVLAEEAVAGMDGLGAGHLGGGDHLAGCSGRTWRWRGADADVLVGEAHVQGVPVGLRVDRHGLDAQLLAGQDHPQGDLAPVGDEDLPEGRLTALGGRLAVRRACA